MRSVLFVMGALASVSAMFWWVSWALNASTPYEWWGLPLAMTGAIFCGAAAAFLIVRAMK